MKSGKTSVLANGLIWFGAGVSIAEILTGTYLASLGMGKGIAAVVLGHLIGCGLLFLAGMIGARTGRSSMETVKMSFGRKGGLLFSGLNVLQLVGWTSIMIYDGALAADSILGAGLWLWCLVIGGLIVLWIMIGIRNLGGINSVAMAALFVLCLVLFGVVFSGNGTGGDWAGESLSFGAAVELSVAMPLSWLPLISDYTREAEKPVRATAVSALVYGLVSCFMYIIGMGAAIYTGVTDISLIMAKAGLGLAGLLIVVLSTVTTTFLDAYSAGVSSVSIWGAVKEKWAAVAAAVVGTAAAVAFPMDNITDFLYLIGSVFAPMIAIQIGDYFMVRQDHGREIVNVPNLLIWAAGFVMYRLLMRVDSPVGSTLPDMAATLALSLLYRRFWDPGREENKNVIKV